MMSVLERIHRPEDLRSLTAEQLSLLSAEIREFLVQKVSKTGGHLGPNLGVVELTVALHRVFDSPRDVLLWDTGHQAYVHKILTGRRAAFDGLRQGGGLSGYPSRAESAHDLVESSHASTALSYADGWAKGLQLRGDTARRVVAVIGDGALTGGLAWEGLNNLGAAPDRPVIVVLNDNGRSYDPTVGGLAAHLAEARDRDRPATLFEQLGLAYIGPVDGHAPADLEHALRKARDLGRPVVVHAVTRKGHGYRPAETDPADRMHGIGLLDPATGRPPATEGSGPSWTSVFGEAVAKIGDRRPDLVCVSAAMRQPVGLKAFAEAHPERFFDVGIAEQHAVTSAAGLAMAGLHPVVCIYATFLNRAYDQVVMDVALHRLPVTLVLDRAGITGPDGASHHGMWDLSLLTGIPGMRIAVPRDAARLEELLTECLDIADGPTALRFPKATAGTDLRALARMDGIDILHRGAHLPLDVLLVAAGTMAGPCLLAAADLNAQGIGVTVVDPRWVIPVNPALPHLAARHRHAFTVEDGTVAGGIGSALAQACTAGGVTTPVHNLGLDAAFVDHGDRQALLTAAGLDAAGITAAVTRRIREHPTDLPHAALAPALTE